LSWEWLDSSRRTLERIRFSAIDIDFFLAPDWLVLPEEIPSEGTTGDAMGEGEDEAVSVEPVTPLPSPAWKPDWLPVGFVPVRSAMDGERMLQTYADGLASLTVFVEPALARWSPGRDGQARRGA